jgi:hypothetical protein
LYPAVNPRSGFTAGTPESTVFCGAKNAPNEAVNKFPISINNLQVEALYYDKTYHDVKFPEFLNKGKKSHLPQVTKRLIYAAFFARVTVPEVAGRSGGDLFSGY